MSLDTLPYDMFRLIASPLRNRDLRSLCLVNKKLLPLAQPLLYRRVSLTIARPWTDDFDDLERMRGVTRGGKRGNRAKQRVDNPGSERLKRNRFFRTMSYYPSLAAHISSLSLELDPPSLENTPRLPLTISLLHSSINLRHLALEGHYPGNGSFADEVIDAVPSTIRTLQVGPSILNQIGLKRLLRRLTSLETLDLSRAYLEDGQLDSHDLLLSDKLTRLYTSRAAMDWCPLFRLIILRASKTLTSFVGPLVSIRALKEKPFPHLTHLELAARLETVDDECKTGYPDGVQPFVRDLRLVLRQVPLLQRLEIALDYCTVDNYEEVNTINILESLPDSIETVHLKGPGLYSAPDLVRFLARTTAWRNVEKLEISGNWVDNEKPFQQNIEELCEMRSITFRWVELAEKSRSLYIGQQWREEGEVVYRF